MLKYPYQFLFQQCNTDVTDSQTCMNILCGSVKPDQNITVKITPFLPYYPPNN